MTLKSKKEQIQQPQNVFEEILISSIETEGQSVREAQDDDHVVELAMSISKHGLLEPIVVRKKEDGHFQLLAGFHRLAACVRLGFKTIPSHILPSETGSVKTIALVENIIRRDLSLKEETESINYLHRKDNLSPSQICDLVGKSRAWVDIRLMIPGLPEDLKTELLDGRITIRHAEIISKVENPSIRAILINQTIASKLTSRQLAELTALYLSTPTMEAAIEAGVEKAKEIQETPKTYRKCELCGRIREISEIKFITVCADPISCNETAVAELTKMEEAQNGNRRRMVRDRTDPKDS